MRPKKQILPPLDQREILRYTVAERDLPTIVGISVSQARLLRRKKILPEIIYRKSGLSPSAQGLRYNEYLFVRWLALRANPKAWERVAEHYYSLLIAE
jgi:hypothetical protein